MQVFETVRRYIMSVLRLDWQGLRYIGHHPMLWLIVGCIVATVAIMIEPWSRVTPHDPNTGRWER